VGGPGSDGGVGGWQRRVGAGAGVAAALPWRPPGTTSTTTAAAAAGPDWARSFRGWWAGRPAPFFTLLFFFLPLSLFFLFSLVLLREWRGRKKGRRGGVMRAVARF